MVDHYGTNYRKELYYVEKGAGQPVVFIHGTVTKPSHLTIPVGKI
jgi:pimeloyl-ACP methyl ester carboxylesterase